MYVCSYLIIIYFLATVRTEHLRLITINQHISLFFTPKCINTNNYNFDNKNKKVTNLRWNKFQWFPSSSCQSKCTGSVTPSFLHPPVNPSISQPRAFQGGSLFSTSSHDRSVFSSPSGCDVTMTWNTWRGKYARSWHCESTILVIIS